MRKRFAVLLIAAAAFLWNALFVPAADKHPFAFADSAALRSAHAIAITADGERILYEVNFGGLKGPTKQEWYLVGADGAKACPLVLPDGFNPSGFMKDGEALYGLLEVERKNQLAIVPLATGKPTVIIALPSGIRSVAISPDGSRFSLLADPRPADPLAEARTVVENRQTSLYVVNSDGSSGSWWCPEIKHVAYTAWSPDGSQIAVLSQTPKIGYHSIRSFIDVCNASGVRRVGEIPNMAQYLAWTADGRELAFVATTTRVGTPDHVWTVPAGGGSAADRTPNLVGTAMLLCGDPQGHVWVFVTRGVGVEIDSFRDGALAAAYRWPGGIFTGLPVFSPFSNARERYVFNVEDPEHTENVAVVRDGRLVKITREGDEHMASISLGAVRVVEWTTNDGTKLQGLANFPAGYEEG
ncbi:MAG: hypothetical protein ABFD80_05970 [Acidobacteriota bacterium]